MSNYDEMKYAELQSACKERELPANGTKEDLIARLQEADGAGETPAPEAPVEGSQEEDTPAAPAETDASDDDEGDKPVITPAEEAVETRKAEKALRNDARAMKAALDKQSKVSIMIPFEAGEKPESGKKVPFHVCLNGYPMDIPRGRYVEVPQQVADVIKERLESEGKIGAEWRIDRDQSKLDALS